MFEQFDMSDVVISVVQIAIGLAQQDDPNLVCSFPLSFAINRALCLLLPPLRGIVIRHVGWLVRSTLCSKKRKPPNFEL